MQMPLRALIIEDSEDDTLLIVHRLERAGYKLTYERLETKDAMRDALDREKWDIIISDYKMPGFSGLAALKLYKEKGLEIPFIIVSGTIGEEVAAEAIISGAHDYVMKNNLSRLIPSIQRELKNAGSRRERRQAEEALKKSEDNYRAIYENATEGIFQTTPEGQFISVNPALARMIGYYTPEELIKGVTDLSKQGYVNPEDRVRYKEILEGQGTIYGFETQHYRKDGSIIWVSINARAVKDEAGKILYYEGTAQDVTQRKQAEEKLRHEKQRLSILTENAPFGMAMIDKDGNFAYINPKFKEIFGYDLSDIPDGRTWFTKAYPDQVHRHTVISAWLEDLRRAGPGEKRPHVFSATCKDGTEKIINFISVQMETGVHIMTCEDITLQKKSEEALLSSRKQLSDIIEFLPDATFVIDKDKKVIAWNRALEQLTGVKKEDILGKGDQAYSIPFYGGKRPILIDLVFEDDPEKHQ
ncbi:MAG: PAS domain S-box protein [Deltaproteobacteria bacterium]